jgi:hypothetical protein
LIDHRSHSSRNDYETLGTLDREELASMIREFLDVIADGGGGTGYMLLLRYLLSSCGARR